MALMKSIFLKEICGIFPDKSSLASIAIASQHHAIQCFKTVAYLNLLILWTPRNTATIYPQFNNWTNLISYINYRTKNILTWIKDFIPFFQMGEWLSASWTDQLATELLEWPYCGAWQSFPNRDKN